MDSNQYYTNGQPNYYQQQPSGYGQPQQQGSLFGGAQSSTTSYPGSTAPQPATSYTTSPQSQPQPVMAPKPAGPQPGGSTSYTPYFYKVVLLGEGGVGKSALTCMFVQNLFIHDYDPTIENSYKKQCEVDGRLVTIDILDTAGQEEYIAMRDQHIRRGQGFVLVYSVVQRPSYQGIDKIYAQIQRAKDDDRPPCVLIANKIDLAEGRQVSSSEGQQLASSLNMQYMETSVKNRYNVTEAFVSVVREIDRHHTETGGTAAVDPNAGNTAGGNKPSNRRRVCTLL